MAVKVVDASVLGAFLFGEPEAALIVERLQADKLIAPALLPYEVANVCVQKLKRHPDQRQALLAGLRLLERMAIQYQDVDVSGVTTFADTVGLTAYDASYLWLARKFNAELVTLDHALLRAIRV
jgi:predicted nucleic acid-binding protein